MPNKNLVCFVKKFQKYFFNLFFPLKMDKKYFLKNFKNITFFKKLFLTLKTLCLNATTNMLIFVCVELPTLNVITCYFLK